MNLQRRFAERDAMSAAVQLKSAARYVFIRLKGFRFISTRFRNDNISNSGFQLPNV